MLQFARNDRLGIGWGINKLLNQGRDLMNTLPSPEGSGFHGFDLHLLEEVVVPGPKKGTKSHNVIYPHQHQWFDKRLGVQHQQ